VRFFPLFSNFSNFFRISRKMFLKSLCISGIFLGHIFGRVRIPDPGWGFQNNLWEILDFWDISGRRFLDAGFLFPKFLTNHMSIGNFTTCEFTIARIHFRRQEYIFLATDRPKLPMIKALWHALCGLFITYLNIKCDYITDSCNELLIYALNVDLFYDQCSELYSTLHLTVFVSDRRIEG